MGDSEVGYSPVYANYEGTVKKVAYGSGLGWFIWVISPDKYVEIYQDRTNEVLKETELKKLNSELAKNIEFLDSTLENSKQ